MAQYTPDGMLLKVLDEGEGGEEQQNPNGAPQRGDHGGAGNGQGSACGGPPFHVRVHGAMGGPDGACRCSTVREYDLDPPGPPNILNQLVAALHDTGLEGNPHDHQRHRPDARYPDRRNPHEIEDDDSDEEEDDAPQVKISPPIFKGLPRE